MNLTEEFIDKLKAENAALFAYCNALNKNLELVNFVNQEVSADFSKGILKVHYFVLSDFLHLYEFFKSEKTINADFVIAYYYDVLRNGHFAEVTDLSALKALIANQGFENTIKNILSKNKLNKVNTATSVYFGFAIFEKYAIELFPFYARFIKIAFDFEINTLADLAQMLKIPQEISTTTKGIPENDTLEKTLQDLNELIGLTEVKKNVEDLVNYLKVQKIRTKEGLKIVDLALHSVFYGPPGTGKTTVARLLGRIFKHLGFLSKGQLYETDREGLVAGYVGQTAIKVDKVIEESLGGVLFIDEAYALTQNLSGNDFGSEAVNILLKRMEDQRDDFAVIVAGYTEPMSEFISSNPGLRSRFNRYFNFDHFKPSELLEIFEQFCKKSDFQLSEDARDKLLMTFELLFEKKNDSFGNARTVRNLFEICIQQQANRLVKLKTYTKKALKTFEEADIPEPNKTLKMVDGV
jgi:stage V sporulation protein K